MSVPIRMVALVAAGDYCTGLRFRRRDGMHFSVEYVSSPLPEGGAPGAVVTFRDITSREAEQERLVERIALLDPVTGLPNRVLFRDRLEVGARPDATPATAVGDLLARPRPVQGRQRQVRARGGRRTAQSRTARRFEAAVRATDTVSRFGGDEFAIVCEHLADEADVALVAGHLLAALEEPFELEGAGTAVPVRASIGASLTLDAELTAEDLLARAELRCTGPRPAGAGSGSSSTRTSRARFGACRWTGERRTTEARRECQRHSTPAQPDSRATQRQRQERQRRHDFDLPLAGVDRPRLPRDCRNRSETNAAPPTSTNSQ